MANLGGTHFYKNLPHYQQSIGQLLADVKQFEDLPIDWDVIITDIRNSTLAVDQGRHQLVNLLATGSIIAVINIAQKNKTEIPFFFGGDGATMLVPKQLTKQCLAALRQHSRNSKISFSLDLRVDHVPMSQIHAAGHFVRIAKLKLTRYLSIPVVLGQGLAYAERQIKSKEVEDWPVSEEPSSLDLSGMECRWDNVKPPRLPGEVIALLIDACQVDRQAEVFGSVLAEIERIYGPIPSRNPISIDRLHIKATLKSIRTEMQTKLGGMDLIYLFKNWLFTLIGRLYYGRTKDTKIYLANLVQLSDTLTLDGRINTVISGTADQRHELVGILTAHEKRGEILFGYHASPESVMSCYVRNRTDQHIHFVDGSQGGYTQAARMLKRKLSEVLLKGEEK